MERLPLVTPGVRMRLGLRLDQGGESDWIEIRMEDEVFTLGRGGSWIDGSADSEAVFEAGVGYRDGDAFQASNSSGNWNHLQLLPVETKDTDLGCTIPLVWSATRDD